MTDATGMADTGAMTETDTGHAEEPATANADHDDGHGAAAAAPLGPIDGRAWAAAIVGGAIGVVLVIVLLVTIGDL